ncbi:MAG: hypothetical protein AB7O38_15175 [Pirellulaceae bacterium]
MSKQRANEQDRNAAPRKTGEGSLAAWARQGHKEISQILPAFPDSVKVVEEPGMPSNPTSYEVTQQRGSLQGKGTTVHGKQNDRERDMEPEWEP